MKFADNEGSVFYAGDSSFVGMTFNKGLLPDTKLTKYKIQLILIGNFTGYEA